MTKFLPSVDGDVKTMFCSSSWNDLKSLIKPKPNVMIRKFTYCLLVCSTFLMLSSCSDDEAPSPPKSSFTVDQNSGLADDTEFTFVVDQVNADAISLLPYGTENASLGGILIQSFTNGKATVKFKYSQVGTFNAVVVTNNHTADGKSVKKTVSDAKTITITSGKNTISDFSLSQKVGDKTVESTGTTIDEAAGTIKVTVPYGVDVTKLVAKYTVSSFTSVKVAGADQKSGETVNNFTNPLTYTVTANNGTVKTYIVSVDVTPIELNTNLKSFGGKLTSTAVKDRVVPGYVDNDDHFVVIYDVLGSGSDRFDSVRVNYEVEGKFSYVRYGTPKLKQDSLLNLTTTKQVIVVAQDSTNGAGKQTYDILSTDAPKLTLTSVGLNPVVEGSNDGFTITLKVLKQTNIAALVVNTDVTNPSAQVSTKIRVNGTLYNPGDNVTADFSQDVKFVLIVTDDRIGKTYEVVYTVSVLPAS
jgi:hypothetical protein